jgi:hypothetical protein
MEMWGYFKAGDLYARTASHINQNKTKKDEGLLLSLHPSLWVIKCGHLIDFATLSLYPPMLVSLDP